MNKRTTTATAVHPTHRRLPKISVARNSIDFAILFLWATGQVGNWLFEELSSC
jgi:hypothetical protein